MLRRKKLIIAILLVILIGLITVIIGALFFSGPDLTAESKNVLVLASDKYEQPNGSVDMAYMLHLENGTLSNYTPVYPGGMAHPSLASSATSGRMLLHDCLWDGTDQGMNYAAEIVEANTGMHADAVVIVYDESLDAIIDSVRPLYVDGKVSNLSATDIVRSNDAYNGYAGDHSQVTGTMSRGDAVMVLVKALVNATKDPEKKSTMFNTALDQYSHGNILMKPEGSFARMLATKGIEKLT